MASRGSAPSGPGAPSRPAAGFIAPQAPPAGVGPGQILPGHRPLFVLLARIDRLEVSGGMILPDLGRCDAIPGVGGNTSADTRDPSGWVARMEREGWRRLPDDLEFECWGAKRTLATSTGCTYRDWYASDRVGGIWAEAWMRPRVLGGALRWSVDDAGKRSLQAAALAWMLHGAELDPDRKSTRLNSSH